MAQLNYDWSYYSQQVRGMPDSVYVFFIDFADLPSNAIPEPIYLEEHITARTGYRTARDRAIVASRALTRLIIAHTIEADPYNIILHRAPPYLVRDRRGRVLARYSMSRTNRAMAVSVSTQGIRTGIDVEQLQTERQAEQLIKIFHPEDQRRLQRVPNWRRREAITQAWTHKEAMLKGLEVGLNRDPALDEIGNLRRPLSPEGWKLRPVHIPKSHRHKVSVAWQA